MIINFTGWLFLSPVEIFLIKKFCLNSFAHLWKQVAILLRVLMKPLQYGCYKIMRKQCFYFALIAGLRFFGALQCMQKAVQL